MRYFLKCLIVLSLIVLGNSCYCLAANNSEKEIKNLVEGFCLKEFQGDLGGAGDRDQLIHYTDAMYKKIRAKTGEYPYVIYLAWDQLFIVDSYKITEIKQINEKRAYAIITYHQLARSKGYGAIPGRFIKDIRDITIKLNLEYDGKRWWIIDPPYPKVSYDVMVKNYKYEVSVRAELLAEGPKHRKLSPEAKSDIQSAYDYEKSILDFLLDLKK